MEYLYLTLVVLCISGQNIFMKLFNQRSEQQKKACLLYLIFMSFAAVMLILCVSGFRLAWHVGTVLFAAAFGICFATTILTNVLAILYGSLSITSLITSYSLIVPTLFGIFFLKEPVSSYLVVGIVLLMISLLLINLKKGEGKGSVNLKWFVCVTIAFFSNAGCTLVQKYHQVLYPGAFRFEFMAFAMCVVLVIAAVGLRVTRTNVPSASIRTGVFFAAPAGIMNAEVNLLVMVLASVPASFVFPVISAGGIVVTSVLALTVYRDKLSKWQVAGLVVGILSVVFLNLK